MYMGGVSISRNFEGFALFSNFLARQTRPKVRILANKNMLFVVISTLKEKMRGKRGRPLGWPCFTGERKRSGEILGRGFCDRDFHALERLFLRDLHAHGKRGHGT
jgi:hypothetical protein